jgi:nucleotide-binding universal stress UspA family protein
MSNLSILVIATGSPDDKAAVAVAADLAGRHASRAVVVNTFENFPAGAMAVPVFSGGIYAREMWTAARDQAQAVELEIEAMVERGVRSFGLSRSPDNDASMAMAMATPAATSRATLMRELPLADLAIVGQSCVAEAGSWIGPLGEALMEARTPVFLARSGVSTAGRSAAVAWDGGFQAARAVRAALPLLKDASAVAIVQDREGLDVSPGAPADPDRLRNYLRRHGVAVETVLEAHGRKVGPAILEAADKFGAALLVAGAYRHARLQEAIVGGVTRTFLKLDSGPHLLISH